MKSRIYLDYNATAPLMPQVAAVMKELLGEPLNASSIHSEGRKARSVLETARRVIAEQIGAFPAEIVFTASGTESNNWVLAAHAQMPRYITSIEHSSVRKGAPDAVSIGVNGDGVVDINALAQQLPKKGPFLLSLMLANNETGIMQPVQEAALLVHARGGLLHCDGAQVLGKAPVDFTALGCDFLTLCGHKMGGPIGAAALVVKNNIVLLPAAVGGGQELNRRAGTENVAAIAGFGEAVKHMNLHHMQALRGWLDDFEAEAVKNGGIVIGKASPRLPNTSCIAMPRHSAQTQMMRFDLEGIAISAGAACTSGKVEGSPVLAAMGLDADLVLRVVRISGGWATTQEEITRLTGLWKVMATQ